MKVIIFVGGRFHAFNLAEQLNKRGLLAQLITSYPMFEVVKYGIDRSKITSLPVKEIIERSWRKLPDFLRRTYNAQFMWHEVFDKKASKKIVSNANLFVGWSGFALHSLRQAKKTGLLTVLERGSSHIEFQNNILKDEYNNLGLRAELPHPKIIEKELKEYQESDYISVPSLYVKRTFLNKGISEKKIIHVPYGVNLEEFRQIPKNDDIFRVVFAGGMSLRKGVHYLLQAFSELNLPNSELLLVGSLTDEIRPFFKKYGVEKSANQEISKSLNQKSGRIRFLGHKPQKDLHKYYSQGSVFAIMSIEEGLAMVQPQAMACGLPVICTTNTGGEDIVRDGKDGFVIPIRDVEALKEKLVYLYENPDARNEMSKSAKERVSSGFTWDDYGDKMVRDYARIIQCNNKKT